MSLIRRPTGRRTASVRSVGATSASVDEVLRHLADARTGIIPDAEALCCALETPGTRVQTLNLHHLQLAAQDPAFFRTLRDAHYVTADGWPVLLLFKLLGRAAGRVTGSRFVAGLLTSGTSENRLPGHIGLLGTEEATGRLFGQLLTAAGRKLVYREHGRASTWDHSGIATAVEAAGVECLLVAVTPPTGEHVAAAVAAECGAFSVIGVGGAVEMAVGNKRQAPPLIRKMGAEWAFRLIQEPRRLVRRYILEGIPFFLGVLLPAVLRIRRIGPSDEPKATVVHVGLSGDRPGGMAQVVNRMMEWQSENLRSRAVLTTRRRRDPLAPLLLPVALARIGFRALICRFRQRPMVIVAHLSEGGSFLREGGVVVLAGIVRIPVVVHLHGARFLPFIGRHPNLVRTVLSSAHAVVVLTEETRKEVASLLGCSVDVHLVRNFVPAHGEYMSGRMRRVVFAGEVSERKGFDVLIAAWNAVQARHAGWTLDVFGPDPEGLAARASGVHTIEYHGPLPNADVQQALQRARVAVLPSRDEALPMFVLEAMAAGCAVIATSVGELPAVINDSLGRLVKPGDAGALIAALDEVMGSETLAETLGRAARRAAQEYSPDAARSRIAPIWMSAAAATAKRDEQCGRPH